MKRSVAAVAVAGVAVTGFAVAAPAMATSEGAGLTLYGDHGAWGFRGAQIQDGSAVYCLDWTYDAPIGSSPTSVYRATSLAANGSGNQHSVGGDALGRINYVLSTWGGTGDNVTAAAVDLAVASYLQNGGVDGMAKYVSQSSEGPAVLAAARSMVDQANSITIGGSVTPAQNGTLAFTVDDHNNFDGTVYVDAPAGSHGPITLTNGVFKDTGSNYRADAQGGATYPVRGVPTEDGRPYKISGDGGGQWTIGSGTVWPAEVDILEFGGGMQRMARAIGPVQVNTSFNVSGSDPNARTSTFQPVLTSQAASFADNGDLVDVLTFATAADANGVNNSWAQKLDGSYMQVGFKVSAYGPYPSELVETSDAPQGAPLAGTTTILAAGPVDPGTVRIPGLAAGYYTFVAEYDPTITPAITKRFLPAGYSWKHNFGMAAETTVAPMQVKLSSQIAAPEVALSGRGDDTVVVENDGYWLQQRGGAGKVPVVLTGEYVYLPEGTTTPSDTLPAGAQVVGTVHLSVTGPGRYQASTATGYDQLVVPAVGKGSMTWRWSVRADAQPENLRGFVKETAEQYGDPTQTQTIGQPTISTQAQPGAKPGETMHDVATVGGTLPADGLNVSFSAYNVPFGADGQPVWPQGTQPGDYSGFCTPANLIYTNGDKPQLVTTAGDYPSPTVPTSSYAMTLWVEKGTAVSTGETVVEGTCGVPSETTYTGKVTTKAQTTSGQTVVKSGELLWDTALLEGAVPAGGSIQVHLYQWKKGETAVCTEKTLVWTSEPVTLTGGMFPAGFPVDFHEHGGTFTLPVVSADTQYGFIETTKDASGRIVSQGECGEPSETVTVAGSRLAVTGGDADASSWVLFGGLGALGLGSLTVLGAAAIRRRRQEAMAQQ